MSEFLYSNGHWITIFGLILDLVGAIFLVQLLRVSEADALELGVSRLSGKTDEVNLKLPAVQHLLRDSRKSRTALVFLAVGFALQIFGTLLSAGD